MSARSRLEEALFRILYEYGRVPTKAELCQEAKVSDDEFILAASSHDVYGVMSDLTPDERQYLIEKLDSEEVDRPETLAGLMYLIIEVQLIVAKKALESKNRD